MCEPSGKLDHATLTKQGVVMMAMSMAAGMAMVMGIVFPVRVVIVGQFAGAGDRAVVTHESRLSKRIKKLDQKR